MSIFSELARGAVFAGHDKTAGQPDRRSRYRSADASGLDQHQIETGLRVQLDHFAQHGGSGPMLRRVARERMKIAGEASAFMRMRSPAARRRSGAASGSMATPRSAALERHARSAAAARRSANSCQPRGAVMPITGARASRARGLAESAHRPASPSPDSSAVMVAAMCA